MEKPVYLSYLDEAEKKLKTADHLIYMTYPMVQDKKILLTILSEINLSVLNTINAILQYEYLYKRIELTKSGKDNLLIFFTECAPKYNITPTETKKIKDIIHLAEIHKKSPMEFLKEDKIIILSESLQPRSISVENIKEYLLTTKEVFVKTAYRLINNRNII